MKSLLIFLLVSVQLCALEIVLNSGKESKVTYAILHLIDGEPFYCEALSDAFDKKKYVCKVNRPIQKQIEPKSMKYAEINFFEKDGAFYIAVDPKMVSRLVPVEDVLYDTKEILKKPKAERYTHWTILFEEKPLYEEKKTYDSLDFPIVYPKTQMPYVGALDLNGKPISYAQSKDIQLYLDIKKEFEKGDYQSVIKNVKRILTLYPSSIFRSELELYQIRSMDALLSKRTEDSPELSFNENDLVDVAKRWSKEFTSDENLPEVLMMLTKAYIKLGSKSDTNYFLDILVSEHPDNLFTKKTILLYADNLYKKKEKDKAMGLYMDVLYSAQDLDVASEAAIRLSDYQMDAGKMKEAKEYLLKVLNVNEKFLLKDPMASYKLAKRLYEHKLYDLAARISDLLLASLPKNAENKELLLKESGDWHAKANEIDAANARYQEYLAAYKNNGEFTNAVSESLDALFFKTKENNETVLENYYDKLIEKYSNDIGQKALLEKANLLFKQKRFTDVLALEEALSKVPDNFEIKPAELIYGSAKALALNALQKEDCQEMINFVEQYKLQLSDMNNDAALFKCFMRTSRFDRAHELSSTHLKDKALQSRYEWAQREVQVLFRLGKYKEAIDLKEDLKTLTFSLHQKIDLQTIRDLFFSYMKLNNLDGAASLAESIKLLYPNDTSAMDMYYEVVKVANESKNDLLLVKYAELIISMQKQFKTAVYTPSVELSYIDSLKRLGRDSEALKVVEELLPKIFNNKDKIRALYQAGELTMKLQQMDKAKNYFTQCVAVNENSSWKTICQQNLELLP